MTKKLRSVLPEDRCELVLEEGTEEHFVFREGVNRGFTMIGNKILRCYLISSLAKELYFQLRSCINPETGECKPSQDYLAGIMLISVNTVRKYLHELKDNGFIKVIYQEGSPCKYLFPETKNIVALHHSEILHAIRIKLGKGSGQSDMEVVAEWWNKALAEYRESDLYKRLTKASVEEAKDSASEIENWFCNYFDVPVKNILHFNQRTKAEKEAIQESNSDGGRGNKKSYKFSHKDMPLEQWNSHHFCQYFGVAFKQRFNDKYFPISDAADKGRMAELIKIYVKEYGEAAGRVKLKESIDIYINNDYFVKGRTITGFSSTYVQSEIKNYMRIGSFAVRQSKINNFTSPEQREAYKKKLEEEFDE